MALSNCQECGKLFNKIAVGICPACVDKVEEDFEKVYSYLKEHGMTHIDKISEDTGVGKKWIMKFLAEGRFEGAAVTYKCENCGAGITGGKLCAGCASKLSQEIQQMQKNAPAQPRETNKAGYYSSLDRYKSK
jgi:flagellar operon protein (TIGR03826 family)